MSGVDAKIKMGFDPSMGDTSVSGAVGAMCCHSSVQLTTISLVHIVHCLMRCCEHAVICINPQGYQQVICMLYHPLPRACFTSEVVIASHVAEYRLWHRLLRKDSVVWCH